MIKSPYKCVIYPFTQAQFANQQKKTKRAREKLGNYPVEGRIANPGRFIHKFYFYLLNGPA